MIGRTARVARIAGIAILLSLGKCGPQTNSPSSLRRVHVQQNWADTHGKYLETNGYKPASCQTCHAEKIAEKIEIPKCLDCHAFPHPESYEAAHKADIKKGVTTPDNPGKKDFLGFNVCLKCHEKPNDIKPGCASCHEGGTFGFTNHEDAISNHGAEVNKRGTGPCEVCHSLDGEKETVFFDLEGNEYKPPQCTECHTSAPDLMHWGVPNWSLADAGLSGKHPDYVFTYKCSPCHGESPEFEGKFKGENQIIPGCSTCHAGFYGKFDHIDPLDDHSSYLAKGNSTEQCFHCHGENKDKKVTDQYSDQKKTIPSCIKCHTKDHLEDDWTDEHKLAVGEGGFNQCKSCHGENFEGGKKVAGCADCHFEGKNYGVVPHLDPKWSEGDGHGAYVNSTSTDKCAFCHSIDNPDKTETQWPDGTKIPTCFKCHEGPSGMPQSHGVNWANYSADDTTTHSGFLLLNYYNPETWEMKLGKDGGGCEKCHYDNDKKWATCKPCHESYPAKHMPYNPKWLTGSSSSSHGENYKAESCTTKCHGKDGGSSKVSCELCHDLEF